jgi:hypothetical protein
MTTPSPFENDIDTQLTSEYMYINSKAKTYFNTRMDDIKKKKQENNPDYNFYNDAVETLASNNIDDLEVHREKVWNYLKNEFNQNTKEKSDNARMIGMMKKDIKNYHENLDKFNNDFDDFSNQRYTSNRQKEIVKYQYDKRTDQLFLMKVIGLTLTGCLILVVLINRLLPYETIYVVFILLGLLILYIIYYTFLRNPARSRREWNKNYYEQPVISDDIKEQTRISPSKYDEVNKKLDKEFDKYIDTCSK